VSVQGRANYYLFVLLQWLHQQCSLVNTSMVPNWKCNLCEKNK